MMVHVVIARDERPARRQAIGAPAIGAPAIIRERSEAGDGPIVLVQCELFFDARRLSPLIPRDLLSGFDACCAEAASFGRLQVPGWGANTMRAEFAALTGVAESTLGYDRFNPYYALARVPLESQVWRLRRAGYRTICLHPFDRRFFRRDLAMPALGFERFLCRETLGGSSAPPYRSDPDLAGGYSQGAWRRRAAHLHLCDHDGQSRPLAGERTAGRSHRRGACSTPQASRTAPNCNAISTGCAAPTRCCTFCAPALNSVALRRCWAFTATTCRACPRAFTHFGFDEPHSDYMIWDATTARDTPPRRVDMPADRIGRTVTDRALGRTLAAVPN